MTRRTLARMVLVAGLSAPGTAAFAQPVKSEPVIWTRQGAIRTIPGEFTAPPKVAAPEPYRSGVLRASFSEAHPGPTKAASLRGAITPVLAVPRSWASYIDPAHPFVTGATYRVRPASAMQPQQVPQPMPQPKKLQPLEGPPQFHRVADSPPRPAPAAPAPQSTPPAAAPCHSPPPATPVPPPTWHGHTYPVQPFSPPGAFPILPTGPGDYTLLESLHDEKAEKPPRWPYPRNGAFQPPFDEISFTYLDPIAPEDRDWAEKLKRMPLGEHWLFSTGGEARSRYNSETNSRLSGTDNTYALFRNRMYADVWYEDRFRFYGEFLYGDTLNQDLPPQPRDVNRGDIQQMFVDAKLTEIDGHPVYFRAGRQEMYYGSQRLVSTVDWGNARPRFDGFKLFYRSDKLDADLFVTRPVQIRFAELDPADHNQTFSGAWFTYKPKKGTTVDAYYLNFENDNPGVARGQNRSGSFNISTFGTRFYSKRDSGLLIDAEAMLQTGHWADQSILAHAYSAYAGWYFQDAWGTPTVWAGYDYASGDPDPNRTGRHQTFNQLFAFGHYYMGFTDLVARQNIHDFTVQGYLFPSNWITAGIQYHVFRLDSSKDALYNAAGAPIRQSPTGAAGFEVGSEIDVLANFHLTDRQDVFLSYSHFSPGTFVKNTGPAESVDYLYAQYSWRW